MPVRPKPLNKRQRAQAERARKAHAELLKLTGAADKARATRDGAIAALLGSGVRPFVAENETGTPRHAIERIAAQRGAK